MENINHKTVSHVSLEILNKIYSKMRDKKISLENSAHSPFNVTMILDDLEEYPTLSIQAIERTFKPIGWECYLSFYKQKYREKDGKLLFGFCFKFTNIEQQKFDDLPF